MTTDLSIHLGPYYIDRRIGSGGMADVWHGTHVEHGVEVAVKTLRNARDDKTELRFRREVQAVARLDHPGIIRILDYGAVPDDLKLEGIESAAPYFVMEHADGESLGQRFARGVGWSTVRRVLMTTLDALAHAHARGIIHRDLKPDNILGFADGHWKLADFGIANIRDSPEKDVETNPSGTPAYMSPEQFRGLFRDIGPWTDLYSLGCLAWQLTTGQVPFDGESTIDIAQKHFVQVPGEYVPLIPVPDGLEEWIRRLLTKVPYERYTRAADAAWALERLGDLDTDESATASASEPSETTPGLGATLLMDAVDTDTFAPPGIPDETRPDDERPPIRRDWRPRREPLRSPLDGASPRLVGLRWTRTVGRDEEQDVMWNTLCEVASDNQGRTLVIRGAAGCGKSRLARWLTVRGHEVGVSSSMRAQASRELTPEQTPAGTISDHLGFGGLDERTRRARLERLTERYGWQLRNAEMVLQTLDRIRAGERPPVNWEAACDDVLRAIAARRPLVVWIDDLQWASHWMSYLDGGRHLPGVLFVGTVRAEETTEEPVAGFLQRLLATEHVVDLPLEELSTSSCVRLVTDLLRVERALAERIAHRADGNPMFATQLVADWLGRGLLVARAHGWELRDGVEPTIPFDVTRVWLQRVEHLLADRPENWERGLELAAVLGKRVRRVEYDTARERRMPVWEALGDALAVEGLIVRVDEEHWAFVHEMLREAIVQRSTKHGAVQTLHDLAADGLQTLQAGGTTNFKPRIGRHLFEAGEYEAALEPLREGAKLVLSVGNVAMAERLLERYRKALELLGRRGGRERWEGELVEIRRLHRCRQRDEAIEVARVVAETAQENGWSDIEARAYERMARIWNTLGRETESGEAARKALRLFETTGDVEGAANAYLRLGDHHCYRTTFDEARRSYARATQLASGIGEPAIEAWAHYGLGFVETQVGNLDKARKHLLRSMRQFRAIGHQFQTIAVGVSLGDVERLAGNFERAEELYRETREMYGVSLSPVMYVNYCLLEIGRGQIEPARRYFDALLERKAQEALTSVAVDVGIKALTAFFLAADDDYPGWSEVFRDFLHTAEGAGVLELDTVYEGDVALREAIGRFPDRVEEFRDAIATVAEWWQRLERPAEAEALSRLAD